MTQLESLFQSRKKTSVFGGNAYTKHSYWLLLSSALERPGFQSHCATTVGIKKLHGALPTLPKIGTILVLVLMRGFVFFAKDEAGTQLLLLSREGALGRDCGLGKG